MSASPVTTRTLAVRFVASLARELRGRMLLALAGALAVALAEGAGLVLLVPLLGTMGLTVSEGPTTGLAHAVERAFGWFGLQPTLPTVLAVFVTVSLTHATLVRANSLIAPRLEQQFITSLRQQLYAALIGARWSFLAQQKSSDLVHAVTVDIERVSMATYQLFALASASVITVAYLAVALRLSVPMTLAATLGGVIVLWAMRGRTQASERLADVYMQASREVMGAAAESMTGLKVLKALGDDGRHVSGFGALSRRFSDTYVAMLRSLADSKWRLDLGAAVLVTIVLLVAVGVFELRGAGLLLLLFIFARVVPRLAGVQQTAQLLATGLPSFGSVMSLIDRCEQEAERLDTDPASGPALTGDIRLDDVSFRYTETAPITLDRVTLDIPAGRTTAIVGASGAGKSTLADLVMGLLTPVSGVVSVGGRPLDDHAVAGWRRSVGYVAQDGFLLHDTIRNNLRWARPTATEADMWEALELAAARTFVEAHPDRLDAVVGDRGIRLSGGERQRLALARALIVRPSVLILDEATSALDAMNEAAILAAIGGLKGRLTILLITHRIAATRHADLVYVLEGGRLVERGPWAELAARPAGKFRSLVDAQRIEAAPIGS